MDVTPPSPHQTIYLLFIISINERKFRTRNSDVVAEHEAAEGSKNPAREDIGCDLGVVIRGVVDATHFLWGIEQVEIKFRL